MKEEPEEQPAEVEAGEDGDAVPETTATPEESDEDKPITSAEQLAETLKEVNPGMTAIPQMQPYGPGTVAVVINNDHNLQDISPLKRLRISAVDLSGCDVRDLSPLEGMPIMTLYLEGNAHLTDLGPVLGMPLQSLYISETGIENLGPLRGAPLEEFNALGTRVKDLSPLSESPIKMLWLTGCPVKDISPLKKVPLVSLTLENTLVDDISPLAGHPLQRLHIAGTKVTDLSPLEKMQLTRLIFTPANIKTGIEFARQMESLQEIDTTFDGQRPMPPQIFWQRYDAGDFK